VSLYLTLRKPSSSVQIGVGPSALVVSGKF
jgi:hypothetical protein